MGSTGFEVDAYSLTETAVDANGGAKYGAIVDSELAEVIAAWEVISPAAFRSALLVFHHCHGGTGLASSHRPRLTLL